MGYYGASIAGLMSMPSFACHRLLIRGVGLVPPSSLGRSAISPWSTFQALMAGQRLGLSSSASDLSLSSVSLARQVGCAANAQADPADPSVYLAETAARQALTMANVASADTAAILGVSKGAMHAWTAASLVHGLPSRSVQSCDYVQSFGQPIARPLPTDSALAVALGPVGYLANHLARRLSLSALPMGVVAACASSLAALDMARRWMLDTDSPNPPRRVLVMTSEAAILPAFVHSYLRLGVLPISAGDPATYQQKPLDETRSGFVLAEQGAAILLEVYDGPPGCEPTYLAELLDTATACEAFDLVRPPSLNKNALPPSPLPPLPPPPKTGPSSHLSPPPLKSGNTNSFAQYEYSHQDSSSTLTTALEHVAGMLMAGRRIDLLHPHATGTVENDRQEMAVYDHLWRYPSFASQPRPDVYACKGALGHGLGAAGLTALVLAVLCGKVKRRPPMPWLNQPMACGFDLSPGARALPASNTQAVFAAGFGGHVAGAIIGLAH